MKKTPLNTKGFGFLGVLVIVLVVAVAGFSGWLVWHKNYDTKKTSNTHNSTSSKDKDSITTDPYAGWKTYCEEKSNYCFRYPESWNLTTSTSISGDYTSVNLTSPDQKVYVDYSTPFVKDGDEMDFYVSSIENIAALSSAKALGGFTIGSNDPKYEIIDSSQTSELKPGVVGSVVNTARFAQDNGDDAQFVVRGAGSAFTGEDEAKNWFNTDNAKTGRLILKSLRYNQ